MAADAPDDEIRSAAVGLPVTLHPDASGAELRDLYGRASIFWHAAGLGEDPDRHPDRYEHFGITTVEAMSAGAVPVVIDAAGQIEIVEQGVSGYRFAGVEGLVANTELLIADPAWRATLAAARAERPEGPYEVNPAVSIDEDFGLMKGNSLTAESQKKGLQERIKPSGRVRRPEGTLSEELHSRPEASLSWQCCHVQS